MGWTVPVKIFYMMHSMCSFHTFVFLRTNLSHREFVHHILKLVQLVFSCVWIEMLCVRFCGQCQCEQSSFAVQFPVFWKNKTNLYLLFHHRTPKDRNSSTFFWLHAALYLIKSFFYFPFLNIINRLININIPNDETTSATVLLFPFAFQREILQQVTPTYQGEKYQQVTVMGQTGQEVQVSYKVNAQNFNLPLRFQ